MDQALVVELWVTNSKFNIPAYLSLLKLEEWSYVLLFIEGTEISHQPSAPDMHSFPVTNIPQEWGPFLTTDEL